jgi:hypothetical protein
MHRRCDEESEHFLHRKCVQEACLVVEITGKIERWHYDSFTVTVSRSYIAKFALCLFFLHERSFFGGVKKTPCVSTRTH